jgi:hypothetical protein
VGSPAGEAPQVVSLLLRPGSPRAAAGEGRDLLIERASKLEEIGAGGTKRDWPELKKLVEAELAVGQHSAEVRQVLQSLQTPAEQLAFLARCQAALDGPGAGLPAGLEGLPAGLQKEFQGLHHLENVEAALLKPSPKAPDVPTLQRQLDAIRLMNENLAQHLKLDLALKAQVEQFPAEAQKLLPSPEELARIGPELRDLTRAGEGIREAGAGRKNSAAPESIPLPEAPTGGTRPSVKESL